MKTLLQINASMQKQEAQSSKLSDAMTNALLSKFTGMRHIKRDLSKDPIPHLDQGLFQSFHDPKAAGTPAQQAGLALSDTLVSELIEADFIVLGVPMYNLMIPSTLKAWIDFVTRARQTFKYTERGPVGLLEGKKCYIAMTQGGSFLGTTNDLVTAYLKVALGLIGITDIEFIYAQGLALGPQAAEAGISEAHKKIAKISQITQAA
ncbi:FMN-dependent NADH-azoreductase [Pseudovibrio ascidiaceicola]|uniref:FMN-dependent NADH-azoreductase n=1 Tax=Pseudovibrio ascidiaceicola TaxID=285279 RepID=UPI000D688EAA|nr:NAD(P)H-dependent oxidoreductase [Pseudovibrio ascidiaceicola]